MLQATIQVFPAYSYRKTQNPFISLTVDVSASIYLENRFWLWYNAAALVRWWTVLLSRYIATGATD